ncbi:MAG TPA: DNA/RNA helicase domain-containing protein [Chthoniobacterales bacterium]|nr:DNA/RNA helicase domain-containing protein [Chthoniobacterales bacterium]
MPAFFRATVAEFFQTPVDAGMLKLTGGAAAAGFELKPDQHEAWLEQWTCLQSALRTLGLTQMNAEKWSVLLEYEIAGRRKRLDCVLLTDAGLVAIEFKVGADAFESADRWQLQEYCWNLRDFHRESRGVPIAPILVATNAPRLVANSPLKFGDRCGVILDTVCCGAATLVPAIDLAILALREKGRWSFDAPRWDASVSAPTPSVVECARRLFEGHDVREISHAHADNTDIALECLHEAVKTAREENVRIICFVTGVPGAGKTLVGLNAAYRQEMIESAGGPVCFASGNQPLLDVLQAALVMNRTKGAKMRREVAHDASTPVKNVHDFALATLTASGSAPPYNVVVFDEAQRVWSAKKLRDGLAKRQRRRNLSKEQVEEVLGHGESEPDLLLALMERCDWCMVVALVGSGQEIHDGEAGLAEWGQALARRSTNWKVWLPPEALGVEGAAARVRLFAEGQMPSSATEKPALHLAIAKRSYRAEKYAEWVNLVIAGNVDEARTVAETLGEYPIWITRDLSTAKDLLRKYAGEDLRAGLLASSGALRLRADGIEVSPGFRGGVNWPDWFLRPVGDIRSSSQLEVSATEFECQGLELDWCGICWGGDFVVRPGGANWESRRVRTPARKPPRWYFEKLQEKQEFARNKYRVLLTRGRIGVVIFVPRGDERDQTREPVVFDSTANFLVKCGATRV